MLTGAGAGAAAGGLIGALKDSGLPQEDASCCAESVRRGAALVTLPADESRAERVAEILGGHGAIAETVYLVRCASARWLFRNTMTAVGAWT